MVIVFVGPSACGKTVVGKALAKLITAPFLDADDFHTPQAKERMHAGQPLTDEERWPWLERIREAALAQAANSHVVVACSALNPELRNHLKAGPAEWKFVALEVAEDVLRQRLRERKGHFFPATLLDSQLRDWQPLSDGEGITVDGNQSVDRIAQETREQLQLA